MVQFSSVGYLYYKQFIISLATISVCKGGVGIDQTESLWEGTLRAPTTKYPPPIRTRTGNFKPIKEEILVTIQQ